VQPQCVYTFAQLRPMKADIPTISSLAIKTQRNTRYMISGMYECMKIISSFIFRPHLIFVELRNFEMVQLFTPTSIPILFFDEEFV